MRGLRIFSLFLLYLPAAFANKEIPIWPDEVSANNKFINFSKTRPLITGLLPRRCATNDLCSGNRKNNHAAVLIIPGGVFLYYERS